MYKKPKISIIGAGNIGGTCCYELASRGEYDLVLIDKNLGIAQGKALDIMHACTVKQIGANVVGSNEYNHIHNSNVVIVTAGRPRQPGMTREDLLEINTRIIIEIAAQIKLHAPKSFIIVVTNPLDAMVHLMHLETQFSSQRVVGMAGILDTARFKHLLSQSCKAANIDINTLVLGGHGDEMVPMLEHTSIGEMPLSNIVKQGYITEEDLKQIVQRTRNGGAEIVSLLGNGSAFYAPAAAAIAMTDSYIKDLKNILPCSVKLDGEYGINDMYFGAPVVIGKNGVEKIWELDVDPSTQSMINASAKTVAALIQQVENIRVLIKQYQENT